jgi:hypothetical protein
MPDIFDDTISEVHEEKSAAAAGATPAVNAEVIATEGQSASPPADDVSDTQASDQPAEPSEAAGEGAREGDETPEAQATTESELVITGHESPEELSKRDGVAAKFMRRTLPLVKQAGGMQMLRAGADIVAAGNDPATTGEDFAKTVIGAIGAGRWTELRNDIVFSAIDSNREVVLRDLPTVEQRGAAAGPRRGG